MKRRFQKLLLALSMALMLPLTAQANLTTLNQLFVFGDSLSDGGNYKDPDHPRAYPPSPYADAHYSNGPTAVEYLWQAYHPGDTTFKPSNFEGTNYALGGATSGTTNFNAINPNVPSDLKPWFAAQGGVATQVDKFANACSGCFVPDESLFVVWAFPNDVFSNAVMDSIELGITPTKLITNGVKNILGAMTTLMGEGATNFLIPNMPDLGKTPAFSSDPTTSLTMTGLTVAFNSALADALTSLDQAMHPAYPTLDITLFNTFDTLNTIIANPSAYGFGNVTQACVDHLLDRTCNTNNWDTWLFWDSVHPTTAAHAILGAQFAAAIPEPNSLWLVALALMLLTIRVQLHRRRLAQASINSR